MKKDLKDKFIMFIICIFFYEHIDMIMLPVVSNDIKYRYIELK